MKLSKLLFAILMISLLSCETEEALETTEIEANLVVNSTELKTISTSEEPLHNSEVVYSKNQIKSKDSQSGIVRVELEFGRVNKYGELEYSDIHTIEYNFGEPSESMSETLELRIVENLETEEQVSVITVTGGIGEDPPNQGLVITWPGYVFDNVSSCYVYGYYSYDTDTGQGSFTAADPATQSTMNNCNYGDIV